MKNPKNPKFFLAALLIGTALAIVCTACADADKTYTVKYEITGPETVASFVLYVNSTGDGDRLNNVNIPWSHTITVSGKNIDVGFSVGFDYSNENTYTAKIYVNGKQVASTTSSSSIIVKYRE